MGRIGTVWSGATCGVVAGLMGMNVGGIPLAGHEHGFFVMVALLVSATSTLAYFVLRLRRRRE